MYSMWRLSLVITSSIFFKTSSSDVHFVPHSFIPVSTERYQNLLKKYLCSHVN